MSDQLEIRYVALSWALDRLWGDNPKEHDLVALARAIAHHGFKDAPKYEPELNDGRGGIAAGNGRLQALAQLLEDGAEPPRGIAIEDGGAWHLPVAFGVDAPSRAAAEAYGIDHNSLTFAGRLRSDELKRIYDLRKLALVADRADADAVSLTAPDLELLREKLRGFQERDDAREHFGRLGEAAAAEAGGGDGGGTPAGGRSGTGGAAAEDEPRMRQLLLSAPPDEIQFMARLLRRLADDRGLVTTGVAAAAVLREWAAANDMED